MHWAYSFSALDMWKCWMVRVCFLFPCLIISMFNRQSFRMYSCSIKFLRVLLLNMIMQLCHDQCLLYPISWKWYSENSRDMLEWESFKQTKDKVNAIEVHHGWGMLMFIFRKNKLWYNMVNEKTCNKLKIKVNASLKSIMV